MELMERWASRSDAWTPEDDVTLAELVLRHIREGSTQLVAFDEAAALLGRTSAACGYRWNGVVRRHYEEAIREAKQVRRRTLEDRRNRRPSRTQITLGAGDDHEFTLDLLIRGLRDFERRYHELQDEVEILSLQKKEIEERASKGEAKTSSGISLRDSKSGPATPEQLEEDSRMLLEIMERARRIIESGHEPPQKPRFRMDQEANVERVAHPE
ncbi:MAG: RsfA family transcriptional regulator [Bacilli bacterium]